MTPFGALLSRVGRPEERVVAKQLSNAEFKLVTTPKLLRFLQERYDKKVFSAEDLKTCPTLQFRGKYGLLSWWQLRKDKWEKIEINPILWCNNGETLLAATLAHEGLSLYPFWWIKDHLASGELIEVPVDAPVSNRQNPNFDVFLLYQQEKYKIPKIKHCVDFIVQHLTE